MDERFNWIPFYQAVSDKLLEYKDKRTELVAGIHDIAGRVEGLSESALQDQFRDGVSGPLKDICPFTTMGIFNRNNTESNRKTIASELAKFLGVEEPVPDPFKPGGVPILNSQRSWFFDYDNKRNADDIERLWAVFAEAIRFAESNAPDDQYVRSAFINAYDKATRVKWVGWNLTMGLYWIRPRSFPTLDERSRKYIKEEIGIQIGLNGPNRRCNANDYLTVLEKLEDRFRDESCSVHSFPELSSAAYRYTTNPDDHNNKLILVPEPEQQGLPLKNLPRRPDQRSERPAAPLYSVDNILEDGCFLEEDQLEQILRRLRTKKNLILQGPPGTGKTWLAKRLAFALIGRQDESRVRAVQFHPNLSYEDFVRGWRPAGDSKLALIDGPFLEMINAAVKDSAQTHVLVIEEINRGNPAQIFGEMLTLLEADKRAPEQALELSYRRAVNERVHISNNLYVIGTMNIADRSLALVDLALRRRFAFIDLEPIFGEPWFDWVREKCDADPTTLEDIQRRIKSLNDKISADPSLGPQFRIGHSYLTPTSSIPDTLGWFIDVVETEIGPLLDEYWFDTPDKAHQARQDLLKGF